MQQQQVLNSTTNPTTSGVAGSASQTRNSSAPFQPKDTTFTKIFVGGLSYHSTDDTLRRYFERFGDIEEAVVITDRQTGKSKGYGFVTMSTKEAANQAVCDPNPVIDGRKANVNLAYLGAKPRILPSSTGLIPIQVTNAYQTLANAAAYGLQPICFQTNPNGISPHQFLATQPANFLLSTATASNPITGAGSFIDLALQGAANNGVNQCFTPKKHMGNIEVATNPAQAAFYNAAQLSLLEAAIAAATSGRGNLGLNGAALFAPTGNGNCAINPISAAASNPCNAFAALPSAAHQVLHHAFALQTTPAAAGAYQTIGNALLTSNVLGGSVPQAYSNTSPGNAPTFDKMTI